MYEHLRRSDVTVHKVKPSGREDEQRLAGYEPSDREKQQKDVPRQRMLMENSFGQVSLGISDSGRTTFAVSTKKTPKQRPAAEAGKMVAGQRAIEKEDGVFVSNTGVSESAVIYREEIRTKRQRARMLERIKRTLEQEPNDSVQAQLSFLSLTKDKRRLAALADEMERARQAAAQKQPAAKDFSLLLLERQKEALQQEIAMKEKLRRDLLQNMSEALQTSKKTPKKNIFEGLWWLADLLFSEEEMADGADGEDTPPKGGGILSR